MWQEILKAIPVYLSSMLKFIIGPLGGFGVGLHLFTTILTTVCGTMTVVFLLTFFGDWMRARILGKFKRKKLNVKRAEKFELIWKRYGLFGVALLTPIILTPIGGTLLAVSSGSPRRKIIVYMFISSSFWSVVISSAIYFFGNEVLPEFLVPERNF